MPDYWETSIEDYSRHFSYSTTIDPVNPSEDQVFILIKLSYHFTEENKQPSQFAYKQFIFQNKLLPILNQVDPLRIAGFQFHITVYELFTSATDS
jgi:hypothetical protein